MGENKTSSYFRFHLFFAGTFVALFSLFGEKSWSRHFLAATRHRGRELLRCRLTNFRNELFIPVVLGHSGWPSRAPRWRGGNRVS
jgi:hypothetical protein